MPLKHLVCSRTGISDLTPLAGMPLTDLWIEGTQVVDFSVLKGMKLTTLWCGLTRIHDLSVLKGMPLTILHCGGTGVSDLTPLSGMALTQLNCGGTRVSDLSVLKGMPLALLRFDHTPVADLSPLAGMSLTQLGGENTRVSDLTPLAGMPITQLWLSARYFDPQIKILRSLPCQHVNGRPAEAFWKVFDAKKAAAEKLAADCATLPAEQMEDAVRKRLEELNPNRIQAFTLVDEGGYRATLVGNVHGQPEDVSPLMAVPKLKKVVLQGGVPWLDLSPLVKTEIEALTCSEDQALANRVLLGEIRTLRTINGKPAKEYLEETWKKATTAAATR